MLGPIALRLLGTDAPRFASAIGAYCAAHESPPPADLLPQIDP